MQNLQFFINNDLIRSSLRGRRRLFTPRRKLVLFCWHFGRTPFRCTRSDYESPFIILKYECEVLGTGRVPRVRRGRTKKLELFLKFLEFLFLLIWFAFICYFLLKTPKTSRRTQIFLFVPSVPSPKNFTLVLKFWIIGTNSISIRNN